MDNTYDIVIIGGGAVGCAIARELSKYRLKVAVAEKEPDVACGTSGRNSAVVHAGFNNKPDSLMAKFCVEGNLHFEEYCQELDVPYFKTGKLLVAFDKNDLETLQGLYRQGERNGCKGLFMLTAEELDRKAPYVKGIGAMFSSNTAIINPFLYTIALAENAHENGVEFLFNHELTGVNKEGDSYKLFFNNGLKETITARYVINSAGLYSDKVSQLFGINKYHIYPCRGQYLILDKRISDLIDIPVYPAPRKGIGGLGIHVTPTSDGTVILGPSAEYIDDCDDYESTRDVIDRLLDEASQLIPDIKRKYVIGQYTGIRSKQAPEAEGGFRDFTICAEEGTHLINLIGIESPGLTSSIPIARHVCSLVNQWIPLTETGTFIGKRKAPMRFRDLPDSEKERLINQCPEYGEVVCRCEGVTKKEIEDAIENPLGTVTIAGIKNRTRCMTGRCQGGVCLANLTEILINEYGYKPEDIVYRREDSKYYTGRVK